MTSVGELPLPSWFRYRQGKAEPAGENCYKLTAPVAEAAFIGIRPVDGRWEGVLAVSAEGPDRASTGPKFPTEIDAWHGAFELYRSYVLY